MTTVYNFELGADKPLTNPKDDQLGYASFARHLAESICNMSPVEGLVLAIYGPWGSGKTTLLNFVVHYLQQRPSERPVIVPFNPWWFSGHEDLTRRFFARLQAVLSKEKVVKEDLRKKIADLAELLSEAPLPSSLRWTGKLLGKLASGKHKEVPELKEEIADALRKLKLKILVIIDDIDRLSADEIRQLFRVIKTVADFPYCVYLLAFDKTVAIKALEVQPV